MSARRHGLGRGLDALLPAVPGEGVRKLAVTRLEPNRYQPRHEFDEAGLEGLAESIREHGIVQPIVVAEGEEGAYRIIAGERRWRAAQRAGLAEVPVVVRRIADDRELLETALVENLQRADLNPVEEAEAFQALARRFSLSQEEIARRVGRSRAAVSNALRLLKLPPEVLDLLRDGRLSAGQARPLVTLDAERCLELARLAVSRGLPARKVEGLASRKGRSSRAAGRRLDADSAAAAERLTERLQTKVEIRRRGQGGTLVLHFHGEEELMRLYDLLIRKER